MAEVRGGSYGYRVSLGRYKDSYGPTPMQTLFFEVTTTVPFFNRHEGPMELFKPLFWTRKLDDGTKIPVELMDDIREVVGKVCVYDGEFTDAAIEIAAGTQMLALIVTQPPTEAPLLPVFCLSKNDVEQALSWGGDAKVVVEGLPGTPAITSGEARYNSNPKKEEKETPPKASLGPGPKGNVTVVHPLQTEKDSPYDERGSTSKPSYLAVAAPSAKSAARDSPRSDTAEDEEAAKEVLCDGDDDDFGGTEGGAKVKELKKEQGLVGKVFGAVTGAIFGSDKIDECFRSGAGWTKKGNYNDYRNAMDILSTLDGNEGATKSIVERMPRFLQHAGGNLMLKLAFAGLLWAWTECPGKNDLLESIISVLERLNFESNKPDLMVMQSTFREDWKRPNVALGLFFTEMIKHVRIHGRHNKNTKLWVNVSWLWMTCGLLKSPIEWDSWDTLRKILSSDFWLDSGEPLRKLLRPIRFCTMALFLQGSVHEAHNTLTILQEERSWLLVEPAVEDLIKKFARRIATSNVGDCTAEEWKRLFQILGGCFFQSKTKTQEVYNRLIDYFMQESSFEKTGSFQRYSFIVDGFDLLNANDPFKAVAKKKLQQTVCSDLGMQRGYPQPKAVHELLSSSWSSQHLNEKRVIDSFFWYVHKVFERREVSLQDKLLLLDGLHALVGETMIMSKGSLWKLLRDSLSRLSSKEVMEQAYQSARDYRGIYGDPTGSKRLAESVSKVIVDAVSKDGLMKDLPLLQTAVLAAESSTCGTFAQCLAGAFKSALVRECTSMRKACLVIVGIVASTEHKKTQSMRLASMVLCKSFPSWRPRSIYDMASEGVQVVTSFLHCLHEMEAVENIAKEVQVDMSSLKRDVRRVFVSWLDDFQCDQLSSEGLGKGLVLSEHEVWPIIASRFDITLPTTDDIKQKVARLEAFVESIGQSLAAPNGWNLSLGELLRVYDCPHDQDTQLSNVFKTYSLFVKAAPGAEFHGGFREETFSTRTLKLIREDALTAKAFWDSCANALNVCDYFSANPSIIFQDKLALASPSGYGGVYKLRQCVEQACHSVQSLFCREAALDEIKEAVSTLENSALSPELEVATLRRCSFLDLCHEDCDRFLLCLVICSIYEHLGKFVTFCEQFKFAVVEGDTGFVKMKQLIDQIVSENQIDDPEDWCRRLHSNLFTENEDAADPRKLESLVPLLRLFGCLSSHQEIWKLADEKKWFGKEGLNSFLNELDHLTNVHLDSYNETFLEVMEPAIRVISILGELVTETKIPSLFENLLCNEHLQEWLEQKRFSDFRTVQNNLGDVRQWFCEGRDEIATVYSDFQAICRTGRYFLSTGCSDSETGATLHLEYKSESDTKMRTMDSSETQAFVEQLTIIQHDDSVISDSIEIFLEQHAIIQAAALRVVKLYDTGAVNSGYETFTCSVGKEYVEEAQKLLSGSRRLLEQCEIWLQNTRKRYPLSLLFWPEELREIHTLGNQDDVRANLVSMLLRLFPLDEGVGSEHRERLVDALFSVPETSNQTQAESWLLEVSRFIQNVYEALGEPRQHDSYDGGKEVVVHTVSCDDKYKEEVVLHILQTVYKDRLPMDYEILDGLSTHFSERLPVFLERAKLFTSSCFVILNIEKIKKDDVAAIRSFLTRKDAALEKLRLHCIQRESTLPQASPFFEHRGWTNDKRVGMPHLGCSTWRERIVDDDSIKGATLVVSSSCCTGKTRYIRAQQELLEETADRSEIGTITVHESSTADDLAGALASKFSNADLERSLHLSILSIPKGGSEIRAVWLQQLNKFFFALFVLRVLHQSKSSFHVENGKWRVFVEFPSNEVTVENWREWVQTNIPILGLVCEPHEPTALFQIDQEARRVCTYLRAYDDGSINDRFEPAARKQIVFVLDRSESMEYEVEANQTQLSAATDCALSIFDSHVQCEDVVGVVLFNHQTTDVVRFQRVDGEAHKADLRAKLDGVRHDIPLGGGTHMYSALSHVIEQVESGPAIETWVVVLTDGDTDKADTDVRLREQLQSSRGNLHLIIVGVSLFPDYEEKMRLLCKKYHHAKARCSKGFYVGSDSTLDSLQRSFLLVSKQIPVSQTFDLLGAPTDEECRTLISEFSPFEEGFQNMQLLSFWIRFLYRRVKVLDKNDTFNFNETKHNIGSCLMKTMISEVSRLITANQQIDWLEQNFAQLVYDFTDPDSPEFRLLCTSPSLMDEELKQEYEDMELPGFGVPSEISLNCRSTLDRMISQAMGVPLEIGNDGEDRLRCIDDRGFVLTLDFTVKLLNIHERVATGAPCIIEGETGVSKTALTEMYSFLRNSALAARTGEGTISSLTALEESIQTLGHLTGFGISPAQRLAGALRAAQTVGQDNETELSGLVHRMMLKEFDQRSPFFENMPPEFANSHKTSTVIKMIEWFETSRLERTFFELNVHSSLGEEDVVECFRPIRAVARKLIDLEALVVVFLDEINTASNIGLFKELVVDRSLRGDMLEENIVIVAACNPVRRNLLLQHDNHREVDLGRSWTSGHYQVAELPPSMACVKWYYGSLNSRQEKDFILRRISTLAGTVVPPSLRIVMTEMISASQQAMREFAVKDLERNLRRQNKYSDQEIHKQSTARSKSVVSLRDIQRVFVLFEFFLRKDDLFSALTSSNKHRHAMLLSVAVVYYMRLDQESRSEFLSRLEKLPGESHQTHHLLDVLNATMEKVISNTSLRSGIAPTRGLKENLFATLVCTLSRTPLMIVGPPGCSKTLSVNAVGDNASGEESPSTFYRLFPRLSLYHYQCSKESTSTEIAAVFEKATRRQQLADSKTTRCVVFMDEAGLPEEKRESLKVLHYLLEGGGDVGFVAVSNHVVDAAKSNRTCMCFRSEPDEEEMLAITQGVLVGYQKEGGSLAVRHIDLGDGHLIESIDFCQKLCHAYSGVLHDITDYPWLDTFFGLRDYIYFLKALRSRSSFAGVKMLVTIQDIIFSLERNFNGIPSKAWKRVAFEILRPIVKLADDVLTTYIEGTCRCPTIVLSEALSQGNQANALQMVESRARFKLIIDCSDDDSIMRLLNSAGLLDLSKKTLFKLSQLPEEKEREKLRLISGVKFAAMQGHTVLLSQTESVDESFYDLQNQNFREIETAVGVSLYANIAVGGVSHRSPVDASFNCIVHVRESQLADTPAPFLNRFEKYRLDLQDVLSAGWASLGGLAPYLQRSRQRTGQLIGLLGEKGLVGWEGDGRSLDSIYINLLPKWALCFPPPADATNVFVNSDDKTPIECIVTFLGHVSSMRTTKIQIRPILETALECLPEDLAVVLRQVMGDRDSDSTEIERYQGVLKGLLKGEKIEPELRTIQEVCATIIQMIFTSYAVSTLLDIATPEAVYAQRQTLPRCLVEAYFSQEHFSLKTWLSRALNRVVESSEPQLLIAHTRTDASIHSIPSYGAQTDHRDRARRGDRDAMRALVCEEDDTVLVEHLSSLPSEASFRKALTDWASNKNRRVFLLLVDMSKSNAFEKVNYIRMSAEQCCLFGQKVFALVLHYPASSVRFLSYPALFLGNWKHAFLDGVGQMGPSLGLSESIQMACRGTSVNDANLKVQLCSAFSRMMPIVNAHLACKNLFYKGQGKSQDALHEGLFLARRNFVTSIFATPLGTSTVGSVLYNKFASYWLDQGLESTIKTACLRLQRGTTQLSVTGSIHSTILEVFNKFMVWCMKEMNTWRGLDVLQSGTEEAVGLFGFILDKLPVLPFDELILLQERGATVRAMPPVLDALQDDERPASHFPFFFFVSSCLEEVLEFAAGKLAEQFAEHDVQVHIDAPLLLQWSMDELSNPPSGGTTSSRESIVCLVVDAVLQCRSLFDQYIHQFVQWKASCSGNRFISSWLENSVLDLKSGFSIVAVHCVARCCEIDFMKAASWSMMAQRHPAVARIKEAVDSSQWQFGLLLNTVDHLECVATHEKMCDKQKWSSAFSSLLEQLSVINGVDKKLMCRVRFLCVANIVVQLPASEEVFGHIIDCISSATDDKATQRWKPSALTEKDDLRQSASLSRLFGLLKGDQRLEESLIQQFFSPLSLATMKDFQSDDFNFLLDAIENGMLRKHSHQSRVSLLRRACTYFGPHEGEPTTSDDTLGLPGLALRLINAKLSLNRQDASKFEEESAAVAFPHFIPSWLQIDGADASDDASDDQEGGLPLNTRFPFFSIYKNTLDGTLVSAVFEMLLRTVLTQSEELTSTTTLQRLLENLEVEEALVDDNRLARLQGLDFEFSSLDGSIVATLIVDARTICFVAGLARDLAISPDDSALSGPYNEMCQRLLQDIMEIPNARFADFFFSQVRRHKGEACLMQLLSAHGPLYDFPWCQEMKDGMPSMVEGQEDALRQAEEKLAETYEDEQKKARELRLCPHCGLPFGVAARECGMFKCGQDAHGVIGREVYGCGGDFQVDTAPWYRVNEDILAPLRATVEVERASLSTAHHGQMSWNRIRDYEVPELAFLVGNAVRANLVPAVSILDSCDDDDKLELVRVLIRGTDLAKSLSLLADLVELYVWLHLIFGQIVSKEEAMTISMGDIMKRERLMRRFDPIHTKHMLSLWERVVGGVNCLLEELECKAAWGCALIDIPFNDIEEARLISLLSEGTDPSDGFDSLFLIINQIISRYNNFVRQLSEVGKNESPCDMLDEYSIHPKFIMSGSGGAAVVNHLAILSRFEIESLVAGCWAGDLGHFDMPKLQQSLKYASSLLRLPPSILNPMDCLRTKFVFRRVLVADGSMKNMDSEVYKSPDGTVFARAQDLQLVRQVQDGLNSIGLNNSDVSIRHLLCGEFQKELDSHNKTCAILGGLRNLVEALSSEQKSLEFANLRSALVVLFHGNEDGGTTKDNLMKIGFPELGAGNVDLLVSLHPEQVVELVRYLGFQLASEGYLYSTMHLCMSEPLSKAVAEELVISLEVFGQEKSQEKALACLKEFVRDVLVYYEIMIEDTAVVRDQPLRDFLAENNLCGSEDPVFALLPHSIGLRNYIALRQHLQQAELSFLHRLTASPEEAAYSGGHQGSTAFANMSAGRCWLWQQDGEEAVEQIPMKKKTRSDDFAGGLWFADCPAKGLDPAASLVQKGVDKTLFTSLSSMECTCRIQRWWRNHLLARETAMCIASDSEDEENYFDTLSVMETDMDMDMEEELEEFCDYDEVEIPVVDTSNGANEQVATYASRKEVLESSPPIVVTSAANANETEFFAESFGALRTWLERNHLPGTMAGDLEGLGIRSIEDLVLTMNECEDILDDLQLPKLDKHKLKRAVGKHDN